MPRKKIAEGLSVRGYCAHRKAHGLRGHALTSVQWALRSGRIARTCGKHERCPWECKAGKLDPERADADWTAHTTPGADRGARQDPELIRARMTREVWAGRTEQLRFEERAGTLTRSDVVAREAFAAGRRLREGLTQVRLRLAPLIASEKNSKRIDKLLADAFGELHKAVFKTKGDRR